MANHTLNEDYNGKTTLRKFWPIVKSNFANLLSWFNAHVSGTADRHTAADVDYDSSTTVGQKIAQEITDRQSGDSTLQANLNAETTNRTNADSDLQSKITDEITNRQTADTTLQNNINAEVTNRQNADNTLRTDLNSEITNRENADTEIKNDIGNKNNLNTTNKDDLVSAINELKTEGTGMPWIVHQGWPVPVSSVNIFEEVGYHLFCAQGGVSAGLPKELTASDSTYTLVMCIVPEGYNAGSASAYFDNKKETLYVLEPYIHKTWERYCYQINDEDMEYTEWVETGAVSYQAEFFNPNADNLPITVISRDGNTLHCKIDLSSASLDTKIFNNFDGKFQLDECSFDISANTEGQSFYLYMEADPTREAIQIHAYSSNTAPFPSTVDYETMQFLVCAFNVRNIDADIPTLEIYRGYTYQTVDWREVLKWYLEYLANKINSQLTSINEVAGEIEGHVNNASNPHNVTKEQIGLGNVDNTSDADKPVSAAQQAALNLKSNKWVATTTGYSTRYSVTLDPAPTALEVGMTITIIPHVTSTEKNVTLNVNGLGAKYIRQRGLIGNDTYTPCAESFLTANEPVTLMYDGTCWIDTTYTLPEWKDVLNSPSSFTPSSHASAATTYGVGSGTNYGHLKLSSATDSTADVDGGTAATPAAAKAAYDKAVEVGNTRIWNSSGVTAANANSWALSSYKLTMSGARNIALAYGYSYDTLVEMLGEGNLLAACGGVAEFNGGTSAIIGGYAHKLNGIRAVILGGYNNIAHAYNAVCGKSCKEPTATDYNSNSGDLFVVGNGTASTRSNGFRVAANGNCYAGVAFNGTGADYNEVREWSDGNVDSEDRCGYMVAFDGIKIRLAQPGDNLRKVGIISGNSCITGNNFADYWHGKYKRDIYGRYETEPVHNDAEYDEDGNIIKEEYDGYSYVLSEDYDSSLEDEYIPRLDRSEYDLMATHGEVVVRDDGTCEADGYCIPGQDGIATKDNDEIGFYVMERVDENHVRVFVR